MRLFAVLAALVMTLLIAFAVTLPVTGAANAGKEHFSHWGCNEKVSWKTNSKKRFVRKQVKKINSVVNTFTLIKHKGSDRPDIIIKFVSKSKMYKRTKDRNVLGVTYYGLINNFWLSEVSVLTPKVKGKDRLLDKNVFVHELWHAVGMDHVSPRERVSLMNPATPPNWRTKSFPTNADISSLKALDNTCKPRPSDENTSAPDPVVDYVPKPTPVPTQIPVPEPTLDPIQTPAPSPTFTPSPVSTQTPSFSPTPTELPDDLYEDCDDEYCG